MKKKPISPESRAKSLEFIYRKLSFCSSRCLFNLAKIMALIVTHTSNQLSRQSTENINLCFPELNSAQKKKLHAKNIHHTCCNFFELANLWSNPIAQVLSCITDEQIADSFHSSKRAKIVIAPHHGSWELLNLWLAQHQPLMSLYKPTRNPFVDNYVIKSRSRNGAQLIPIGTAGLRQLLKGLKAEACTMVLPDQKPRANKACITAPFYQHNAETSLLIKNLASKADCDIYIAVVTRDLKQCDYSLRIEQLDRTTITSDDVTSASYLNQSIENLIRNDISQYQWTYRRFPEEVYQTFASSHS